MQPVDAMENPTEKQRNTRRLTVPFLIIAGFAGLWILTSGDTRQPNAALFAATAAGDPVQSAGRSKIVFNRDIRPILADRCFACHGPDPNKRQAGLRLDRPDAATGPLPKHPGLRAFVPGDPDHSEALRRILTTDPILIMPPGSSHLKLDAKEKDLIRQWLLQGGAYQEHWAFTKPIRPATPAVQNSAWPKNDIDRFVLANLEANGLTPSKQADKATLIRRVSLDLTGIPPTPAEVQAFASDTAPDAYEKVVDRLLASPRYGEQMATQWLDYSRYADSHGFQSDPERHMWKWRDWVINAYNANMPFDQFAIKQLAGDLLPNATMDDRIATGFNRNQRINDEGGIIPEEWRIEGVIDRASTTSAVFLGLTMECCRCHDHKYDPITQKEFYSLCAYFNNVKETGVGDTAVTDKGMNVPPLLKVPTPDQQQKLDDLAARTTELTAKLAAKKEKLPELVDKLDAATFVAGDPADLAARFALDGKIAGITGEAKPIDTKYTGKGDPVFVDASRGKAIRFDGSGAVINAGDAVNFERSDKFSYGAWVSRRGNGGSFVSKMNANGAFDGFDLFFDGGKVAVHIIHRWPDIAIKVQTTGSVPVNAWTHVFATYNGSSQASGVKIYFDGKLMPVKILNDSLNDTIHTSSPLLIGSRDGADAFDGDVADVRIYNRVLNSAEINAIARGPKVAEILKTPAEQRTPAQKTTLSAYVEATDPDLAKLSSDLAELKSQRTELEKQIPDTMVMEEMPQPRDTFLLIRGQYDKPGEKVNPGVPAVLPPLPKDAPPNRLGLAQWIVDPANPLTSRVQANRLWEKFFGVGIVKTSENLGTQSEWPSNPDLLDYLATELLAKHWDLKAFQKEIVMSAAYQQASEVTPEMVDRDPENRLIERGPRFRLTAEEIRDQALFDAGLLVEQIGGPSARPYEPADLWSGNSFGNLATYVADQGAGLYRRSLYTFIKRSAVPANLSLFDQPSREYCVIRRSRTDTPLQALDLMNDPTFVEAARVMAQRLMVDEKSGAAGRIKIAFQHVVSRDPTADESRILLDGFQKNLATFKANPDAAKKLLATGSAAHDPSLDETELAAYTITCSVILNLDETVTRQ
jgi:hypothetical protein